MTLLEPLKIQVLWHKHLESNMKNLYIVCMIGAVIVAVSGFGGVALPAGLPGMPDCEDCDAIIQRFVDKVLAPQIETIMPYSIDMPPGTPCAKCSFDNLQTLKKNGEACSQNFPGGYRQTIPLKIDKVDAKCECEVKSPDGKSTKFGIEGDWSNGEIKIVLQIMQTQCTVVEGSLACENPLPKCMIDPSSINMNCIADDETAKKTCEDQKGQFFVNIIQMFAESSFPALANAEINKRKELIDMINCVEE